jgi:uncharacterized membrane protein HdeD (DUF308 family)
MSCLSGRRSSLLWDCAEEVVELVHEALVPPVLVFYIGFLSIFQGGIAIFLAFRGGGWGAGVLGVLGILFGLILVFNPFIGVATLPFVLGIFMLVGGVVAVVQAFRMR